MNIYSWLNNPYLRGIVVCLLVAMLFVPPLAQVQAGTNPILSIFVGVMFGLVGLIIYDAVSCDINVLFGGCGGGSGNGSGGSGNGSGSGTSLNGSGTGSGSGNGSGGGGNGGLQFAPPPLPTPSIDLNTGFYADPARVRSGDASILHWNVTDATTCAISGGGLSLAGLGITGQHATQAITAKTEYTLTCENGVGGPSNSANAAVNLIPVFEEI